MFSLLYSFLQLFLLKHSQSNLLLFVQKPVMSYLIIGASILVCICVSVWFGCQLVVWVDSWLVINDLFVEEPELLHEKQKELVDDN